MTLTHLQALDKNAKCLFLSRQLQRLLNVYWRQIGKLVVYTKVDWYVFRGQIITLNLNIQMSAMFERKNEREKRKMKLHSIK